MGWFTNVNAEIVCTHCGNKGCVTTKKVKRMGGLDGNKIANHLLWTGGLSLIFGNVNKEVEVTEMSCGKCKMKWHVE
jgi:hypothetical protein